MAESIFLAKSLGIYMVVMALVCVFRADALATIVNELEKNQLVIFVIGVFTLILGVLMVVVHGRIYSDWRLVISLFAWLAFIKGVLLVMTPEHLLKISSSMMKHSVLMGAGFVYLVLGGYLVYMGYFA